MNEREIQNEIQIWRDKHFPVVPNCYAFGFEADLLGITPSGFSIDYEIKVSRADFRAEMKQAAEPPKRRAFCRNSKHHKHRILKEALEGNPNPKKCPNFFNFVCPVGIIEVEEVPDYAGLVFYDPNHYERLEIIIKAPLLHKDKPNKQQMDWIVRGLNFRYWKLRRTGMEEFTRNLK